MTKPYKITTKRGDGGFSDLLFGVRKEKHSQVFSTLADIDNLCSELGVVRTELTGHSEIDSFIHDIILILHKLMACCAVPEGKATKFQKTYASSVLTQEDVDLIERATQSIIDRFIDCETDSLNSWVVYGESKSKAAAHLYKARATARIAELSVAKLKRFQGTQRIHIVSAKEVSIYLNRLSDFLFMLARLVEENIQEPNLLKDRLDLYPRKDKDVSNEF